VVTDFEEHDLEEWFYYWNFSRQRNTDARMDDTTAASGERSMCVFATDDKDEGVGAFLDKREPQFRGS